MSLCFEDDDTKKGGKVPKTSAPLGIVTQCQWNIHKFERYSPRENERITFDVFSTHLVILIFFTLLSFHVGLPSVAVEEKAEPLRTLPKDINNQHISGGSRQEIFSVNSEHAILDQWVHFVFFRELGGL